MLNYIETVIRRIAIFVLNIQCNIDYDSMGSLSQMRYSLNLNDIEHVLYGIFGTLAVILVITILVHILDNIIPDDDEH